MTHMQPTFVLKKGPRAGLQTQLQGMSETKHGLHQVYPRFILAGDQAVVQAQVMDMDKNKRQRKRPHLPSPPNARPQKVMHSREQANEQAATSPAHGGVIDAVSDTVRGFIKAVRLNLNIGIPAGVAMCEGFEENAGARLLPQC